MLAQLPHVDVWGFNVYRGASFGSLFSEWAARSEKPMWLSEYGVDSYSSVVRSENQTKQAEEVGGLAAEIVSNAATTGGVCCGGAIFSWADEWWKYHSGEADVHDANHS